MLVFLVGLSLGACIGAAALGICAASYEHEVEVAVVEDDATDYGL